MRATFALASAAQGYTIRQGSHPGMVASFWLPTAGTIHLGGVDVTGRKGGKAAAKKG